MRNGAWMQLVSGRAFWPADPRPDEVFIDDIAHALSMLCRYGGHSLRFYSVAEHSCHVSDHCPPELALWGLLHDATEAYLVDVPRPIKCELANYAALEARLMACVSERFGLDGFVVPAEVKRLDNAILANEQRQIMAAPPMDWQLPEPPIVGLKIFGWPPHVAHDEFLWRFDELTK